MNPKNRVASSVRVALLISACSALSLASPPSALAQNASPVQNNSFERSFPQSKAEVEKALKSLQSSMSGRLPVLDGFALPKDRALDRYQRGFYQSTVQVVPSTSGGSVVRVTTKVTAWYADPTSTRSGYQLLPSNGRLESDLLDQLADALATAAPTDAAATPPAATPPEPTISAPMPRIPDTGSSISSSLGKLPAAPSSASAASSSKPEKTDTRSGDLQSQARSLEEILKNQAHPNNLVAVRKSGTPVVETPSLTAKTLFLATAHDEFEMLDFNADWVHVRISGLSRGWIWRTSLEMPGSVPDIDMRGSAPPAPEAFHVTREESASFPGDWAPLRGKTVKIISVQKIDDNAKGIDPQARLDYAITLLDKSYAELAKPPQALAGVVLIFDSVDGGMIAATLSSLQQWKAGKLSDAALWHQCFFDPPETFDATGSSSSSASQ